MSLDADTPDRTGRAARGFLPVIVGVILVVSMVLVALTLRRPEPPTFPPSSADPMPAGGELAGPRTFTVEATDPDRWRYFSFARGTLVENPSAFGWDLAFRRFQVVANGGEGFPGMGGIRDLGEVDFDAVARLPEEGYVESRVRQGDSLNAAVEDWYDYSFFSHLLSPRPRVYAVRTADGRYAKVEFLGYYCPGAEPGCMTFRYTYQGGGGPRLAPGGEG